MNKEYNDKTAVINKISSLVDTIVESKRSFVANGKLLDLHDGYGFLKEHNDGTVVADRRALENFSSLEILEELLSEIEKLIKK